MTSQTNEGASDTKSAGDIGGKIFPLAPSLNGALRACGWRFALAALLSALVNVLFLGPPLYMLQVYDRVLTSGSVQLLLLLSLALLFALVLLALFDGARTEVLLSLGRRLDEHLAPRILHSALDPNEKAKAKTSPLLRDFDTFRAALSGQGALALMDAPWAPIYVAVCFWLHPLIGLLALGGGVVLIGLALINERTGRAPLKVSEQSAALMYGLQAADSAHGETARALGMQDPLVARQLRARQEMNSSLRTSGRIGAGFSALTKFARLGLQSAVLGLGAYLALRQEISPGAIIAASILSARAFAPIEQIVGAWRSIVQGWLAFGHINAALRAKDADLAEAPGAAPEAANTPMGHLRTQGLVMKAQGGERVVLHCRDFQIAPGEIVGVIGPSGAGKTTLLRALSGAAVPAEGAVTFGALRLSDRQSKVLSGQIGYMPQDVGLFEGAIADNIAHFEGGDPRLDALIARAATAAGVHEMIMALPDGYKTRLGQNGRGVSAGQAQRIGLARALFGEPALLVLDEPDAHLDAAGEAALRSALLDAKARGAVCVFSAHRASLLDIATKLILVRGGRIEAYGPTEMFRAKQGQRKDV